MCIVALTGACVLVTSCGAAYPGSTDAQQTSGWARSTGFLGTQSTLRTDLGRVATAIEREDPPASIRTDCDVLVTDALSANQNLPAPDDELSLLLSRSYAAAADAGRDCLRGAGGNTALLRRSAGERTQAQRELIEAAARYDTVTVGSPTAATEHVA